MFDLKTVSLTAIATALCTACATPQVNPHYKYSTKYPQAPAATQMASAPATTVPVTYHGSEGDYGYTQNASYNTVAQPVGHAVSLEQARQDCDISEQNYKVAGAAIGGVVGALAGKKLAGDDDETLGLVGGAALGAAAGYGAGDMMVDCDVSAAPSSVVEQELAYRPATDTAEIPAVYTSEAMVETGGQNISQYEYNEGGYAVSIAQEQAIVPEVTRAVIIAPEAIVETREVAITSPVIMATPIPASAPKGTTYIVQEGDTAWSLSRKSCSSPQDIRALNSLEGDFLIKAGEAILLPSSSCQ